jgi:flagellar capping protein FliD
MATPIPQPPPVPTQSKMLDENGLASRPWIYWFTQIKNIIVDSPAFTGVPTVPTAPPMTDNIQVASTAYADAAVLVETDRAETAEGILAASIAAETSRAETAEALLASKASPTFTGVVTEPTPAVLTAAVTATSALAGAASALPSNPLGYLEMSINSVTVKVPYYA